VVFIFDQLEQLRGTLQTEQDAIRSVERIFAIHVDLLKIPYVHAVFTVPSWLKFVLPGTVQIALLSTVHLWKNDPRRTRCKPTWEVFRSLVERRLREEGLQLLFVKQAGGQKLVDDVIGVCGGHFRDLLRLLRDTVVRATKSSGPRHGDCKRHQRRASRFSTHSAGRRSLACRNRKGARHRTAQHRGHPSKQAGKISRQSFRPLFR